LCANRYNNIAGLIKEPEHLAHCQKGKPAWFHQSGFTALSRPQNSDCGLVIVALCGESGCGSPVGAPIPPWGCLVPRGVVGERAAVTNCGLTRKPPHYVRSVDSTPRRRQEVRATPGLKLSGVEFTLRQNLCRHRNSTAVIPCERPTPAMATKKEAGCRVMRVEVMKVAQQPAMAYDKISLSTSC
jgi:hypothetical protein